MVTVLFSSPLWQRADSPGGADASRRRPAEPARLRPLLLRMESETEPTTYTAVAPRGKQHRAGTAPIGGHQWPALGCTPGRDGCTVAAACTLRSTRASLIESCAGTSSTPTVPTGSMIFRAAPPRYRVDHHRDVGRARGWYGHAGVRAGLRRFFSEWEDFSNDEVEAFSDGGDKFAVVTRMRGRSRGAHIPTEMRTSGVLEVREGFIVRIVGHSDPADALAAVAKSAAATPQPERDAPPRVRSSVRDENQKFTPRPPPRSSVGRARATGLQQRPRVSRRNWPSRCWPAGRLGRY